jgi:hypothetical protein
MIELNLLMPITVTISKEKYLLIRESNINFICSYCDNRNNCKFLKELNSLIPVFQFDSKDSEFIRLQLNSIVKEINNYSNLKGIIYLIGEHNLVTYRKSLYQLSKSIFNLNKSLTQILFTNVEFFNLVKLTSAYQYLTYVDLIMQNEHIDYVNCDNYLDCIFNNAIYVDLTKSFSSGKLVYKNL